MGKGLLFFNTGIGDTILANGLCAKFSRHFDKEVFLAEKNTGVTGAWVRKYFYTSTYSSNKVSTLLTLGQGMMFPVRKHFNYNHMFYDYHESVERFAGHNLIEELLDELVSQGFDDLFIMHYSYPFAELGRKALDRGFRVHGYFLNRVDGLMQSNKFHEPIPAVIWDREYIGDRLSRLVTGSNLNRYRDFPLNIPQPIRDKITLFPTSKSLSSNAGNWHMDVEYLKYLGYRVEVMYHQSEKPPAELENSYLLAHVLGNDLDSMDMMLNQIQSSDFIICYDSASFHMAWLTDTPAIVKLKGGFNEEWIPSWIDDKYVFLPAIQMHEEEYLGFIRGAIKELF